jgi:hypothetical protein
MKAQAACHPLYPHNAAAVEKSSRGKLQIQTMEGISIKCVVKKYQVKQSDIRTNSLGKNFK